MPLDGLSLLSSVCEMRQRGLVGAKIEKITQPERDELILYTHCERGKMMVLINASAEHSRAQLTYEKRVNPIEAPMFCMLLRKRLCGGRIVSLEQPDSDRVVILGIEARSELGDTVIYKLVAELMGRYSNIILVNENGFVVDSIRHVAADMSSVRIVLPGAEYVAPPKQQKRDPLHATKEDYISALLRSGRPDKLISSEIYGLAPNVASLLIERITDKRESDALSQAEREQIADMFSTLYESLNLGNFTVTLVQNDYGEPIAIYPFEPVSRRFEVISSVGEALDKLYKERDIRMRIERKSASAKRILQNNIERCEKKLRIYIDAMETGEDTEKLRVYGELITANLYALKAGGDSATLLNYYCGELVSVPLDPRLSPSGNAQKYFKKYQKAKLACEMAKKQFDDVKAELDYLEGQMNNLGNCTTDAELDELLDELRREGYIKAGKGAKKPPKHAPSQPLHYISSAGASIYVGKNNQQNDMLTLKTADSDDMWLHTKNIPGSHCIIKMPSGGEPDKQTLFEAATLAAYYSKARGGENVAVDYTLRKYVKKPSGARPGMVIYSTNKTAYVTPDEALVKSLTLN